MKNLKMPGGNELLDPQYLLREELQVFYGARLADLGCGGAGFFTLQAAKLVGDKGKVYAVDILKSNLKSVESRAKMEGLDNITTCWSNLEIFGATKIHDKILDFALVINVLFQNKKHESILKEATRMLKGGGKLLVADWKAGHFPFGPSLKDKVDPQKIRQIASGLDLKEIKFFEAGGFHYGFIFEKP